MDTPKRAWGMEYANLDGYFWNNTTTPGSKNGSRELNAFHVISLVLGNSQLVIFSCSTSPHQLHGEGAIVFHFACEGSEVHTGEISSPGAMAPETQLAQHVMLLMSFYTRCWVMQLQKQNSEIQAPLQKWNKHFPCPTSQPFPVSHPNTALTLRIFPLDSFLNNSSLWCSLLRDCLPPLYWSISHTLLTCT